MAQYLSETMNYKTAVVSTLDAYKATLTDNIFESNPVSAKLFSKGNMVAQAGGSNVECRLQYEINQTWDAIAKGGEVSLTNTELITKAKYAWVYFAGSVTDFFVDRVENAGAYQLRSMVKDQMDTLRNTAKDDFENEIFSDGTTHSSKGTKGLQVICPSIASGSWSSSYALGGLNPAAGSSTFWRSQGLTMTSVSFSANWDTYMRNAVLAVQQQNANPDMLVTTSEVWGYYDSEILGFKNIVHDDTFANLGFQTLGYRGIPVTWSRKCPADTMYFIDTDYLKIYYNPLSWFKTLEWTRKPNTLDDVAMVVCSFVPVTTKRESLYVLYAIDTA